MNPRERFLAVYSDSERKKLDRVPTFVQGVKGEFFTQNEEAMMESYEGELLYNMQFDPSIVLGFDAQFAGFPGSTQCDPIDITLPTGEEIKITASGQYSRKNSTFYQGGAITSIEVLDKLWANLKFVDRTTEIESTAKYYDDISKIIYPVPMVGGMFDTMWMAMGMGEFSKNYRKKTKLYYETIRFYTEITKHNVQGMVDVLKKYGGVVNILDDVAFKGRTMISPARWEEDFGKHYKEINKIISDAGLIPQVHTDGDVTELVKSFQWAGFRGLQGWEGGMDPVYVNEHFPDFVVIGFGDVGEVLPFGTPEQIDAHVKGLMDALKENRHYVFGPSTVIVKEMPLANVQRFMAAGKKFGQY
jgi:hypothetical protein